MTSETRTFAWLCAAALLLSIGCAGPLGLHSDGLRLLRAGKSQSAAKALESALAKGNDLGASDRGAIELDLARAYLALDRKQDAADAAKRGADLRAGDPEAAWRWAATLAAAGKGAPEVAGAVGVALQRRFDDVERFAGAEWLKPVRALPDYGRMVGHLLINASHTGKVDRPQLDLLSKGGGVTLRPGADVARSGKDAKGWHTFMTATVKKIDTEPQTKVTRFHVVPDDARGSVLILRYMGMVNELEQGRRVTVFGHVVGTAAIDEKGAEDKVDVVLIDLMSFKAASKS